MFAIELASSFYYQNGLSTPEHAFTNYVLTMLDLPAYPELLSNSVSSLHPELLALLPAA